MQEIARAFRQMPLKEFMRCKNCGWPNKPTETVCAKCGSPLESEPINVDNEVTYRPPSVGDNNGLKKTLPENVVFGGELYGETMEQSLGTVKETVCPKCGYPLRPDAVKCPNCNYSVNGSSQIETKQVHDREDSQSNYQRRPTRMVNADPSPADAPAPTRKLNTGGGHFRGTINPYMMDYRPEPAFVLQPILRMNERKVVEPVEFEGNEVILSRENTEPTNSSITSHEQAVITCSDGHWFIENRSEQRTTFVQATKKIELHDGDIILLGNRLFEFKEQK